MSKQASILRLNRTGAHPAVKRRAEGTARTTELAGPSDTLIYREFLTSGQYGFVHRVKDAETGISQAIKVNFIENTTDFIGSWREVDMLMRLQHPYIVKLQHVTTTLPVLIPKKKAHRHEDPDMKQDGLYMFFELGDYDFDHEVPRSTTETLRAHAQILLALEYMHRYNHVHRDVKPANLLYFEDTKVCKLIDFGMCKPMAPNLVNHVHAVTASYRAPELFLGHTAYGAEIDIWSVGATLVYCLLEKDVDTMYDSRKSNDIPAHAEEDVTGPDNDPENILPRIVELFPLDDLPDDVAKRDCPLHTCRPTWAELLEDFYTVPGLQDLLSHMLCWYPESRWTATQCLDHPVFDKCRDMITETRAATALPPPALQSYTLHFEGSPERDIMINECRDIPVQLDDDPELESVLSRRMIFHAMDYVDRYIAWRIAQQLPRPDRQISILRARVCLYLAFKYFNIMTQNIKITKFWPSINLTEAADFEKTLVRDVFQYRIYRPTLFELNSAKSDDELDRIEKRYRDGDNGGLEGYTIQALPMYGTKPAAVAPARLSVRKSVPEGGKRPRIV